MVRVRLGADVTNYVIENVSPNVIYIIKVRPFDQLGNGPSIFQTIMTTVGEQLPSSLKKYITNFIFKNDQ